MKRVMAGLVAGVVVICLLTSPLAAYDRDITLPTTNASEPVWMYGNGNGDDIPWDDPIKSGGARIPERIDKIKTRHLPVISIPNINLWVLLIYLDLSYNTPDLITDSANNVSSPK